MYAPTSGHVYAPLVGQHMSEAYQSVINMSFNVRFGLIMRQAHHWAALIFLAAVIFHMCRIFFTGAFRKPREINWIIGLTLWMVVMLEGFTGYSLPDDLLSGTGIRVIYSIIQSIPFVGTWLVVHLWGGRFPGDASFITRLFIIHEFVFPAAHRRAPDGPPDDPVAPEAHRLPGPGQDRDQHPGQPDLAAVRPQGRRPYDDYRRRDLPAWPA